MKEIASEDTIFIDKVPPASFKRIFWSQQFEAASKKDACSMHWHPLIIQWCLHLQQEIQKLMYYGVITSVWWSV